MAVANALLAHESDPAEGFSLVGVRGLLPLPVLPFWALWKELAIVFNVSRTQLRKLGVVVRNYFPELRHKARF